METFSYHKSNAFRQVCATQGISATDAFDLFHGLVVKRQFTKKLRDQLDIFRKICIDHPEFWSSQQVFEFIASKGGDFEGLRRLGPYVKKLNIFGTILVKPLRKLTTPLKVTVLVNKPLSVKVSGDVIYQAKVDYPSFPLCVCFNPREKTSVQVTGSAITQACVAYNIVVYCNPISIIKVHGNISFVPVVYPFRQIEVKVSFRNQFKTTVKSTPTVKAKASPRLAEVFVISNRFSFLVSSKPIVIAKVLKQTCVRVTYHLCSSMIKVFGVARVFTAKAIQCMVKVIQYCVSMPSKMNKVYLIPKIENFDTGDLVQFDCQFQVKSHVLKRKKSRYFFDPAQQMAKKQKRARFKVVEAKVLDLEPCNKGWEQILFSLFSWVNFLLFSTEEDLAEFEPPDNPGKKWYDVDDDEVEQQFSSVLEWLYPHNNDEPLCSLQGLSLPHKGAVTEERLETGSMHCFDHEGAYAHSNDPPSI